MNKRAKALMQENNELERQLQPEAKGLLTDMVLYLHTTALTPYQREQVRRDIAHMFLDGESQGISATEVIGGDYHSFCDEVAAAMPPPSPQALRLNFLSMALLELGVLGVVFLIFRIFEMGSVITYHPRSNLLYAVTWDALVVGGILFFGGLAALAVTRKNILSQHSTLACALLAVVFLLVRVTFHDYLYEPIFFIHLVVAILLTVGLFVASWVVAQKVE